MPPLGKPVAAAVWGRFLAPRFEKTRTKIIILKKDKSFFEKCPATQSNSTAANVLQVPNASVFASLSARIDRKRRLT
jgi:hypothetical protein